MWPLQETARLRYQEQMVDCCHVQETSASSAMMKADEESLLDFCETLEVSDAGVDPGLIPKEDCVPVHKEPAVHVEEDIDLEDPEAVDTVAEVKFRFTN